MINNTDSSTWNYTTSRGVAGPWSSTSRRYQPSHDYRFGSVHASARIRASLDQRTEPDTINSTSSQTPAACG
jgi:hypothetical protein